MVYGGGSAEATIAVALKVHPHLTATQLEQRFSNGRDVEERERLHCVLLKSRGHSSKAIAAMFLKREDWVRRTVRRYNELGPDGMKDGRRNSGTVGVLDDDGKAALEAALLADPADGGLWSGPKVAKWIRDRTGKSCCNHTGWMYLKRLGYTVQRPRPEQPDANKEDQEVFKRGDLPIEFEALLTRIPTP